jgi:DNA gyrase/topoisomerase IV subunit A
MIQKTADLVIEKKIEGISNVNDESGRDGMRVVYDLKRDAMSNVCLINYTSTLRFRQHSMLITLHW